MKVLFGVFDWGLGHATRDIPLIEALLNKKHQVDIISTGRALDLLKIKFGKRCNFFDVPSLPPLYYKNFSSLMFAAKIPSLLKSLKFSHKLVEKIIKKGNYDKIISDCRFDVYDTKENSYLINHQLRFHVPFPLIQRIVEKAWSKMMKNYKYVFVPDFNQNNLTGKLSHNLNYVDDRKIKYIGILSHLKKKKVKEDIDYFISLSGPELSRKNLEKKIFAQIKLLEGKIVIAGGTPEKISQSSKANVEFYSFLNSEEQQEKMNRAKFVIARGGYTTIMDLVELDKKNILLIPSPKQSEQEYLAKFYEENKFFHSVPQKKLKLSSDIKLAKNFSGFKPEWKTKDSVEKFMKLIE